VLAVRTRSNDIRAHWDAHEETIRAFWDACEREDYEAAGRLIGDGYTWIDYTRQSIIVGSDREERCVGCLTVLHDDQ
jgi:hypothetical protein